MRVVTSPKNAVAKISKTASTQARRIAQDTRKEKNRASTSKKGNKGGRPRVILSGSQMQLAIEYVTTSGLWKVRLAKLLRIDHDTLNRILKTDRSFSDDLEAAEAVFIGKTIQRAKPEFILKTKYRNEFPDNNFDPGLGQGIEEFDAVIKRIRQILPASGQ